MTERAASKLASGIAVAGFWIGLGIYLAAEAITR